MLIAPPIALLAAPLRAGPRAASLTPRYPVVLVEQLARRGL